jgi:outer membrane protein assembly factor BamB
LYQVFDGTLWSIDPVSGEQREIARLCESVRATPAIADGVLFATCGARGAPAGTLQAVDLATGAERWRAPIESIAPVPLTVVNGLVLVLDGNALIARDGATGSERWRFSGGGAAQELFMPAVAGGVVYFGSVDGHLYALDASTGGERWRFEAGANAVSNPVVLGGRVYLLALSLDNEDPEAPGFLHALDASTGQPVWSTVAFTRGAIDVTNNAQLISDGRDLLFIALGVGNPRAFSAESGEELWSASSPRNVQRKAIYADGFFYIPDHTGLAAVDAATGEERWWVALGNPGAGQGQNMSPPLVIDGVIYLPRAETLVALGDPAVLDP